jgi:hypothetical protein
MKKYGDQSRIEPPSFELGNLVKLYGKNVKTRRPARKPDHKMYRLLEILDIISPTAVYFCLPNTLKIFPVFYVSLIDPFIKGNWDVDLNAILKTSYPNKNTPEYDVDKVMGSTEKDGNVVYLVKKGGLASKKTLDQGTLRQFLLRGHKGGTLSISLKES